MKRTNISVTTSDDNTLELRMLYLFLEHPEMRESSVNDLRENLKSEHANGQYSQKRIKKVRFKVLRRIKNLPVLQEPKSEQVLSALKSPNEDVANMNISLQLSKTIIEMNEVLLLTLGEHTDNSQINESLSEDIKNKDDTIPDLGASEESPIETFCKPKHCVLSADWDLPGDCSIEDQDISCELKDSNDEKVMDEEETRNPEQAGVSIDEINHAADSSEASTIETVPNKKHDNSRLDHEKVGQTNKNSSVEPEELDIQSISTKGDENIEVLNNSKVLVPKILLPLEEKTNFDEDCLKKQKDTQLLEDSKVMMEPAISETSISKTTAMDSFEKNVEEKPKVGETAEQFMFDMKEMRDKAKSKDTEDVVEVSGASVDSVVGPSSTAEHENLRSLKYIEKCKNNNNQEASVVLHRRKRKNMDDGMTSNGFDEPATSEAKLSGEETEMMNDSLDTSVKRTYGTPLVSENDVQTSSSTSLFSTGLNKALKLQREFPKNRLHQNEGAKNNHLEALAKSDQASPQPNTSEDPMENSNLNQMVEEPTQPEEAVEELEQCETRSRSGSFETALEMSLETLNQPTVECSNSKPQHQLKRKQNLFARSTEKFFIGAFTKMWGAKSSRIAFGRPRCFRK